MAMYLGEDKVASLGSICNVSGSASKNLFNKNYAPVIKGFSTLTSIISGGSGRITYIPCKPNTTYTIQKIASTRFIVSCSASVPTIGVAVTRLVNAHPQTTTTVTTNSTAKYLILDYYDSDADEQSIRDSIQIELGSTATEYEEYYEPIISVKDSNGDYHEVPYVTGKASKNLFNKNDVLKGYWINNGNIEANALWNVGDFFKVEPNTTYSYSSTLISGKSEIQTTIMYYDIDGNRITHSYFQTLTKTEKTPSNCYYARITYRNDVLENIQFEKGSTITSYEEYYEPTVSIRNSNGVFQEVEINKTNYSLGEQIIGTWIDGKPLYRKVIETTAPSVVGTTTSIATLSSEIQVVKLDGYLHSNANCRYNLNSWFGSTDYIYTFPDMNNHQIKMKVSLDAYKSTKVVLIIEYTKD